MLFRSFSSNMRYYLEANGKTQADLARQLKVSTATTSDWCNGKVLPRIDKMEDICIWLGIDFWDLYPKGTASSDLVMLITDEEEREVIKHYRLADNGTKIAVKKLLDVPQKLDGRVVATSVSGF